MIFIKSALAPAAPTVGPTVAPTVAPTAGPAVGASLNERLRAFMSLCGPLLRHSLRRGPHVVGEPVHEEPRVRSEETLLMVGHQSVIDEPSYRRAKG